MSTGFVWISPLTSTLTRFALFDLPSRSLTICYICFESFLHLSNAKFLHYIIISEYNPDWEATAFASSLWNIDFLGCWSIQGEGLALIGLFFIGAWWPTTILPDNSKKRSQKTHNLTHLQDTQSPMEQRPSCSNSLLS